MHLLWAWQSDQTKHSYNAFNNNNENDYYNNNNNFPPSTKVHTFEAFWGIFLA